MIAGLPFGAGNLDGPGREAYFNRARAVAMERDGSLLVADYGNFAIRRVSPQGLVTTVVGTSSERASVDGPPGPARLRGPVDIVATPDGGAYFVDGDEPFGGSFGDRVLRRLDPSGVVTTIPLPINPVSVAWAPTNELVVASARALYRWRPAGLDLVAGAEGIANCCRPVDGTGAAALFGDIRDIVVAADGTIYVLEPSARIIRRVRNGVVDTLAGSAFSQGDALTDGRGAEARFSSLLEQQLALDADGNLWVTDFGVLRRITPEGQVTSAGSLRETTPFVPQPGGPIHLARTLLSAGNSIEQVSGGRLQRLAGHDLVATPGLLPGFSAMATDPAGNILLLEEARAGELQIVTYSPQGASLGRAVVRAPVGAQLTGFTTDAAGNLYASSILSRVVVTGPFATELIAEGGAIVRVAVDGSASVLAQWSMTEPGRMAPIGIAVGGDGALYFIDAKASTLVRWAGDRMQVILQLPVATPPAVGVPLRGIAADAAGRVSVVTPSGLIRVDSQGNLLPAVGDPSFRSPTSISPLNRRDGQGADARFVSASGAVADANGNVYVVDQEVVRLVTPDGRVTTPVGRTGAYGVRTGGLPGSLSQIQQMILAPDGSLVIASGGALVRVRVR